jgi:plastocyanin
VTVTATDFKLTPASLTLRVGQPVELTFINRGATPHNWAVAGLTASHLRLMSRPNGLPAVFLHEMIAQVARGHVLIVAGPNQRAAIRFTPATAGRYHTLCTLPGHAELGMVGTLVVTNGRRSTSHTARTAPAVPAGMKAMPGMGAVAPSAAMLAQVAAPAR